MESSQTSVAMIIVCEKFDHKLLYQSLHSIPKLLASGVVRYVVAFLTVSDDSTA